MRTINPRKVKSGFGYAIRLKREKASDRIRKKLLRTGTYPIYDIRYASSDIRICKESAGEKREKQIQTMVRARPSKKNENKRKENELKHSEKSACEEHIGSVRTVIILINSNQCEQTHSQ